jgi:two-component system chemotaxis sensor kinase CheA
VEAGTATGCAAAPTDADTAAAVEEAGDDEPVAFPGELGMDENLNDFLCEAREHISGAEEALLELEQDTEDPELVNTVFRAFHTIKGVAGFMNLQPIVQVAHSAEYLLDQARSGNIQLTSAYLELCLNSCDMLTQLIESLGEGEPPSRREHAELLDRLCRASSGELESPPPPPAGSYPPLGQILVDMHIASPEQIERAIAQQRSNADELTRVLREAGVSNEQQVLEEIVNETGTGKLVHDMLIAIELISRADLDKAINAARGSGKRLGELLGLQANELAPALREQRRHRRAATDRTEAEAESTNAMPPAAAAPATTAPPPTAGATPGAGGKPGEKARRRVDQTVKVSTSRMDSLIDMVGELVIAQQMIVQDPSIRAITEQRLQRNLSQSGKIIRDLQEVAMSLRMVTVRGTFQRMARLVRDLGVKAGKKINFHTEGEDTELDRNVVEEIGDPLVHMIRNACDHGLETPEERRAAGKDEEGNLTLRAYHQGGAIVIEIADDGRGIDRDVILRKAMERGVLAPDRDPAEIPDTEVFNLIFMPGFSTAKEVTDISGRGVGMDVVRRNIENLRGRVEIRSKKGRGSTFVMRLPLTMAIIDGMVVRVGSERYVLPTLAIEQSFRPTADQLSTLTGRGEMVMARGALLPIHRLKRVFQRPDGIDNPTDALLIILDVNDHRCCIMVDEILGEQQVVIKSIGQGIGSIRGVSGAAILGDGHVALILDPANLVVEATSMKLAA